MTKFSFLSMLLVLGVSGMAQSGAYSKGDNLLNVGIGVNSYYSGGIPFGVSYEKGVTDEISVGGTIDYLSNKYNYGPGFSYRFTALYIGVRGSYHFNELIGIENEKIDVYGGAALGYRSFSWRDNFNNDFETGRGSYGSGVFVGIFAGGKYYFTDNIGAFAELGAIGSTNVRLGVTFRF